MVFTPLFSTSATNAPNRLQGLSRASATVIIVFLFHSAEQIQVSSQMSAKENEPKRGRTEDGGAQVSSNTPDPNAPVTRSVLDHSKGAIEVATKKLNDDFMSSINTFMSKYAAPSRSVCHVTTWRVRFRQELAAPWMLRALGAGGGGNGCEPPAPPQGGSAAAAAARQTQVS